jgi:hypothetical protein
LVEQDPEKLEKRVKTSIHQIAARFGKKTRTNTRITPNMLYGSAPKEPTKKGKKAKKSKRKASKKARKRNR